MFISAADNLPHIPKRIISTVPSISELLYDLGLDDEVIGITKFCIHPDAWFRSKTRIGGTKQLEPVENHLAGAGHGDGSR